MTLKQILAGCLFLLTMTTPLLFAGPQLYADVVSGPDWVAADDLRVTRAQCTRWEFVVSSCTIEYSDPIAAKITPALHYLVYGSWGGEHAVLMRSAKAPGAITTVQAIRDLGAREATMGIFLLLEALVIVSLGAMLLGGRSATPRDAPLESSRPMSPAGGERSLPAAAKSFGRRGLSGT